jgi:DNA polymerase elongation subunit (family B)
MKQLLLFTVLALALFSCSGSKKQAETAAPSFELDNLLAVAEQNVDETVTVIGFVTHTCKHSGKRCFIVGESQEASLRIEAEGEIDTFSPDLIGSKLAVTGVLKEYHLSSESINEMEVEVKELEQDEEMAEMCATELSNISDMRNWMKAHDKDYYVMYYMDGLSYNILD